MKPLVRSAHKHGNSADEYEDAFAVTEQPTAPDGSCGLRVAIADGVSESSLAGIWARILVDAFSSCEERCLRDRAEFVDLVESLTSQWPGRLYRYVEERRGKGRALHWGEKPALAKGASATLLAAAFQQPPKEAADQRDQRGSEAEQAGPLGTWTASAIGDCCLFHFRAGRLLTAFPLERSEDFNNAPMSINSLDGGFGADPAYVRQAAGEFELGDTFVLASDALAGWILVHAEDGEDSLTDLVAPTAENDDGFARWVAARRRSGGMRNDDVTLVVVRTAEDADDRH